MHMTIQELAAAKATTRQAPQHQLANKLTRIQTLLSCMHYCAASNTSSSKAKQQLRCLLWPKLRVHVSNSLQDGYKTFLEVKLKTLQSK